MWAFGAFLGVFPLLGFMCSASNSTISPLVLQPSQQWDGNDGPWSSFSIQVGSPPQSVRLLPGTSATAANAIWVVRPEGCTKNDPIGCGNLRGSEFLPNASITWSTDALPNDGLLSLVLSEENKLGYEGNAYYGFDSINLGWKGSGLPALFHQLVAGIATKDFYLGSLGLSPLPMNFSTFDNPQPSLLESLREEKQIPSLSWSYTAGAHYVDPPAFGSLTLGGYDKSKFVSNDVTFSFGADQSRDLLVGIQSITSDSTDASLLPTGIYAFVNSLVPHLWLPIDACKAFEEAFELQWDSATELYLLTEAQHQSLLEKNANITIKLGQSSSSGASVDIVMPYGAFDLSVSSPIVNGSSRYFPLKRAQNSTQYALGRTFLQQAYVIADYERSKFSVHQALFPSTSTAQQIVSILPPGEEKVQSPPTALAYSNPVNVNLIIGIVVGVSSPFLIGLCILIFFRIRKRRAIAKEETMKQALHEEDERKRNVKHEIDGLEANNKAKAAASELHGRPKSFAELPGIESYRAELPA